MAPLPPLYLPYDYVLTKTSPFEEAFNEAKIRFSSNLGKDGKKIDFLKSKQSLQEVQDIVLQSMAKYEAHKSGSKAMKWLRNFSQRVVFYADVLDVLVQHHLEFVALAWGGMKLLFAVWYLHHTVRCWVNLIFSAGCS